MKSIAHHHNHDDDVVIVVVVLFAKKNLCVCAYLSFDYHHHFWFGTSKNDENCQQKFKICHSILNFEFFFC